MPREWWVLAGILCLGLLNGLIFVFLVPPWQHYEEPSHFEYAWIIGTRRSLPAPGTFDQEIRGKIAGSMIEHGFFRDMSFQPNLNPSDGPIWIGISVVGGPPLYNILVGLPLGLISQGDIDLQLYAARLMSLLLCLLTIFLAHQIVGELVPPGHPLRWIVPCALALLPGFIDLMTAVNNTVGAVFVFSLFLWFALRLVVRGLNVQRLLLMLVSVSLCIWTKDVAVLAAPLALIALVLSLFPKRLGLVVGIVVSGAVLFGLAAFSWGDASLWYRETAQVIGTRACIPEAPVGHCALVLQLAAHSGDARVEQIMSPEDVAALRGKTVTIGAWMWSSLPTRANLPILSDQPAPQAVQTETSPSFHAMRVQVADNADHIRLALQDGSDPAIQPAISIYYDAITVVEGEWPLDKPPIFDESSAQAGTWDGQRFTNRVRNGSAESGWLWVRPWAESFAKFAGEKHLSPSAFLGALQDSQNLSLVPATAERLFQTFWGLFGWAHVSMAPGWYNLLAIFSALGIVGGLLALFRSHSHHSRPVQLGILYASSATLLLWAIVLLRGYFSVLGGDIFVPVARYAYPVVIPTLLLLSAGWHELLGKPSGIRALLPLAAFVAVDVNSYLTIANHYQ